MEFKVTDIVELEDGTFWLVSDKASEDDLAIGSEVTYSEDTELNIQWADINVDKRRVFPAWQVVGVHI